MAICNRLQNEAEKYRRTWISFVDVKGKTMNEKIFHGFPLAKWVILQLLPTTPSPFPVMTPASVGSRARSQEVNLLSHFYPKQLR